MQKTNLTLTSAFALLASLFASSAHAHIRTTGALMSRGGDIKMDPCDGARGAGPVYTFAPGTTITISVDEYIPHPSYYRIAFSKDGDSKSVFVEPKSIKPVDPMRTCPIDANDKCGEADYCNVEMPDGSGVLWDDLNPHLASAAKSLTFNVTLPNVECDNCTVQVIQVMEDNLAHGDYCPSDSCMDSSAEDIYHVCIDLKLVKGATNGAGATTDPEQNMGMKCTSALQATGGAGGANAGTGGATAGASGAGAGGASEATGAGVGGTTGSALAGTGAAGTPVIGSAGAPSVVAGTSSTSAAGVGATGSAGSASPATSASGAAGNSTGSAAGAAATTPAAKSGGCSVSAPSKQSGGATKWFGMALGLAALVRRRRGSKRAR